MNMNCKILLAAILIGASTVSAAPDDVIDIHKTTTSVVPVSINGFEGEAESVLKFDLSVLGMEITTPDKAAYIDQRIAEWPVARQPDGGRDAQSTVGQGLCRRRHSRPGPRVRQRHREGDSRNSAHFSRPHRLSSARRQFDGNCRFGFRRLQCHGVDARRHTGGRAVLAARRKRGLLYTSWKNGGEEILEHNLATGERRVFAGYPGANFSPEVSPDGQKVAMILSQSGSPNL